MKSIKSWKGYEKFKASMKEPVVCNLCGITVRRSGLKKHQATKKCKNHIDKTKAAGLTIPATSQGQPSTPSIIKNAPVALESHSKILTEINMNKEFDKMAEKFKGGSNDAEKEKKYKYKCDCGAYFNVPGRDDNGNTVCPDCGK